jgi:hypothetical protein
MIANMDAWVQAGTEPPASRYPKIADGSLVPIAKLAFPAIPGVKLPTSAAQGWDLDFGPNWRTGILSKQPPAVGYDYQTLVPQVDADGNELGGIRLPEIVAPLATYTGWNLRDPRASIEARYRSYEDYRLQFQHALDALIQERYILTQDSPELLESSKKEWYWVQGYWGFKATE